MSFRTILLASAFAAALTAPNSAIAENRLALVIGNSAYRTASALPNPANDARAVTELLQSAKFEVVTAADLSQDDMRRAIGEFAATVKRKGPDTVAVVYYAGHGVQVGGENFLIPVDANIKSEAEVALYAIRFDDLMNALEAAPTKARIVILDACRNNPFADMQKTVGRGLAMVNAPVGSVVAYSTSPGTEAEDGRGSNSPFTAAFIAAAKQPGVPVEQTFKAVRLAVHHETEGRQTPWEVLSLTNNFSFFPSGSDPSPAPPPVAGVSIPASPGQTPAPIRVSLAAPDAKVNPDRASDKPAVRSAYWKKMLRGLSPEQAYNLVVSEDDIDGYREFLVLYPKAPQLARVRVITDRRVEMVAWYTAVTANSVGSYRYFLARYASSDMAATAQTLMQRAATRSLLANSDPAALGCNCSVVPTRRTDNTKPATAPKPSRNAQRQSAPAREVIVNEPAGPPPPVGIGIGIGGIGIGGGGIGIGSPGRGSPGGGMGGRSPSGGSSPGGHQGGGTRR